MKTKIIGGVLLLILATMVYGIIDGNNANQNIKNTSESNSDKPKDSNELKGETSTLKVKAEKIEIIEFHNTQRCSTCLKAEELLKKTLDTKFNEEYKSGIITFKDIDIDLPENSEITNKFQASGLSVAINAIADGKDNIEFDMGGWKLVSNEEQYIAYFEKKINTLLGK